MTVAHPIRQYRETHNLSQVALGKKVGVSAAAISRYEQRLREPRGKRLQKLAAVTGISVEQLLEQGAAR